MDLNAWYAEMHILYETRQPSHNETVITSQMLMNVLKIQMAVLKHVQI